MSQRLKYEGEKYIGGRKLQVSDDDTTCSKCGLELEVENNILFCPSLKRAWDIKCFNNKVPVNHWKDRRKEHEDVKVDTIEVISRGEWDNG